ncbi:MAG TPA: GNAT family N-acetyltransferase [Ktedonobacteraceae bacterium]|nr:GNAT family N-acetyltransferase [Ktedonobacteraceae bacterium]
MSQLHVRPARAEDRDPVLAFCTNTWEWGDYIPRLWDSWLHDTTGRLLVATFDERPVGIVHVHFLNANESWLEGLRVDVAYRRQGIGRALTEAAMLEAMRAGGTYVRLMIDSRNTSSMQLSESMHMRRVGSFSIYTAPPLPAPKRVVPTQTQQASTVDLDEIIDYLNVSNMFPLVGGLYYRRYTGYQVTAALLEEQIGAGNVYLLRRWQRLDGLAIVAAEAWQQEQVLTIGYIDGMTIESISLIAYDLRIRALALEVDRVQAYAPDLVLVHDAFGGVEYTSEGAIFHTYERGLF